MSEVGNCRDCKRWSQEAPEHLILAIPNDLDANEGDFRSDEELARDLDWGNCRLFACDGFKRNSPDQLATVLDDWRGYFACHGDFGCVHFERRE